MLLYVDILSRDELFSDAFPVYDPSLLYWILVSYLYSKEVDGIVYEVDCQMIVVKAGADIDIGDSIALVFLLTLSYFHKTLGANPSAEEQDEALEDGATQVNNVVHSFRLQSTTFDKKSYLTYLKVASFYCYPLGDGTERQISGIHEGGERKTTTN